MTLLHYNISLTVKEGEVLLSIEEQNSCLLIGIGKLGSQIFGDSEEEGRRKRDAVSDKALITFSVFFQTYFNKGGLCVHDTAWRAPTTGLKFRWCNVDR